MITKVKPDSRKIDVGTISIEMTDLLNILENVFDSNDLVLTSGDYRAEGTDDVRAHLGVCSGNPTIDIQNIRLQFASRGSKVEIVDKKFLYGNENKAYSDSQADEIAASLKPFRSRWDLINPYTLVIASITLLCFPYALKDIPFITKVWDESIRDTIAIAWVFWGSGILVVFINVWEKMINRKSVTYNPRETFIQRNRDAVFTGVVVAIVTLVATLTVTWVWNHFTGIIPTK